MKLFFSPGTCALSPHIVLLEAGLPHTLVKVNRPDKSTSDGRDFSAINPRGYVPALELDSGEILTEGPAIVQYLGDQVPDKHLVPLAGSVARYHLMERLNFITSELHKSFSPLFDKSLSDEAKTPSLTKLKKRFGDFEQWLGAGPYLLGEQFSVADAYAYTVLSWARVLKIELPERLQRYVDLIDQRPMVQEARSREKYFGHAK